MASELIQVMALIYRIQPSEVAQLEVDLLERRKVAWTSALRERGRDYGCNKSPNAPRGRDLTELKAMSKEDADGITATWNKDVEKKLTSLYNANPKGNRNYYAKQMEAWTANRARWKNLQIGMHIEHSTMFYTQMSFYANNDINPKFVFAGAAPVCRVCVREFAQGIVDLDYVRRHATPRHANCPHIWKVVSPRPMKCEDVWLG